MKSFRRATAIALAAWAAFALGATLAIAMLVDPAPPAATFTSPPTHYRVQLSASMSHRTWRAIGPVKVTTAMGAVIAQFETELGPIQVAGFGTLVVEPEPRNPIVNTELAR